MRILILSQFYPPEVGATQRRIHHFARRLSEKGHRITVISEFPNHPKGVIFPGYSPRLFRRATEDNLDVIRLWVYTSPRKGAVRRILFYFSYMIGATIAGLILARGKYDVVFATSPPLPVALAGFLVALFKRRPFVMDVRDLWPAVGIVLGEIRGRAMVKVAERMESFLYKRASAITCVTRGFIEDIAEKGIDRQVIHYLPNGTIPETFNPYRVDHSLGQRLGLEGKFVVGFCGNHGVAQGLPSVLEAARLMVDHKDLVFLFVGEGPVKRQLIDVKHRDGLDNVLLLPQVPVDEIAGYINSSDVMLVPIRKDALFSSFVPSKLFDCMACAKPVILMYDGEARAIIEEAGAGLYVEPDNPEALCGALLQMRDFPEKLARMGRDGRDHVLKHYLRDPQADRLEEILEAQSR